MLNTKITLTFLSLLRAGLWGRHVDNLSAFPLSSEEWEQVYEISKCHTVEAIVFDGVDVLPKQFMPHRELHIRWLVRVEKIAQRNEWMNVRIGEQYRAFKEIGLDPILLKGQGLAQYYTNPLRRICGDVDWYFEDKKQMSLAIAYMRAKDVQVTTTAGRGALYSEKGCEVDLHANLYDIHNPFVQYKMKEFTKNEMTNRRSLKIENCAISLMSPLQQSVLVNTHILKHLLSFGIGIRQLCDAARLYNQFGQEWDPRVLNSLYRYLNIQKWIDQLHGVLVTYLGLSEELLPSGIDRKIPADWMLEDILQAGNFGFYDVRYGQKDSEYGWKRSQAKKRIWSNCKRYAPYAPWEALFFPITQLYTKITR